MFNHVIMSSILASGREKNLYITGAGLRENCRYSLDFSIKGQVSVRIFYDGQ